MMDWAVQRGPGAARELGYTVPHTVLQPRAIFRGVRAEGEPKWYCYVSRPAHAYDRQTGELRAAWKGQVFLVIVDDDLIVARFRWAKADRVNPDLPADHETGFNERLM